MWSKKSPDVALKFITTCLLIIGGLAWGVLGMTGINPVSRLSTLLGLPILTRIIYTVVGLAAVLYLWKFLNRDQFLPFLGPSMLPSTLLNVGQKVGSYNRELELTAPAGVNAKYVAFWAASPKATTQAGLPVMDAYGDWTNAGVVPVDESGKAVIRFQDPVDYKVGVKHKKSHVHYRWVGEKMMGAVKTVDV